MALSGTLTAYWKQDESGTGTRADATANAQTLTNNNSATNGTGALNNATAFVRASSQYLSRASEALLQTGDIDWFISYWVKYSSSSGRYMAHASKWPEYGIESDNLSLSFYVNNAGAVATWGTALSVDVWYNVTAWHDSVANEIAIVINDGTPVRVSYSGGITTSSNAFLLGSLAGSDFLDGLIDEVAFGKFVPSAADITLLYNGGTPPGYSALAGATQSPLLLRLQAEGLFVGANH